MNTMTFTQRQLALIQCGNSKYARELRKLGFHETFSTDTHRRFVGFCGLDRMQVVLKRNGKHFIITKNNEELAFVSINAMLRAIVKECFLEVAI